MERKGLIKNLVNNKSLNSEDLLFEDIKPIKFEKINKNNQNISGNIRLAKGMYYTDSEKEEYIKKSLERTLP